MLLASLHPSGGDIARSTYRVIVLKVCEGRSAYGENYPDRCCSLRPGHRVVTTGQMQCSNGLSERQVLETSHPGDAVQRCMTSACSTTAVVGRPIPMTMVYPALNRARDNRGGRASTLSACSVPN